MGTDTYVYRPSTKFTSERLFVDNFPFLNTEYYKKFHKTIKIKEIDYPKLLSSEFNFPRTNEDLVEIGYDFNNFDWKFEFSNGDKFVIPEKIIKKYESTVSKIVVYVDKVGYMRKNYLNSFYKLYETNPEQFESLLRINDFNSIRQLRTYAKSKKEFDQYVTKNYVPGDIVYVSW